MPTLPIKEMLNENTRLAYLKAMGIQAWALKTATPAQHESLQQINQPAPQEHISSPAVTSPGNLTSEDILSLEWQPLQQIVSQCQLCELHTTRTQTVFGVGNPNADLLIIGEAPGDDEDRSGEPFAGRAGKLLDAMLHAIQLNRQQVYITNVLKCRTPQNRDPHVSETLCCDPYLQRQITLIQPRVILTLGRIAAHHLLFTQSPLASLRGSVHTYNGIPLIATYHPAYLLRTPSDKGKAWQDLLQVKQALFM